MWVLGRRRLAETFLVALTLWHSSQANLGYFWQITDLHLDLNYSATGNRDKMCWRQTGGAYRYAEGHFGDYVCDSPFALIKSAIRAMKEKVPVDQVEFILWTGDSISHAMHGSEDHFSQEAVFHIMTNLTSVLKQEFPFSSIYPVLGNMDWHPRYSMAPHTGRYNETMHQYGQLWSSWIPPESLDTFRRGGYYAIERKNQKLMLLILNTNLYYKKNSKIRPTELDPADQFAWLEGMLAKARASFETVYIIGHIPPGKMERYMSSRLGYHVYQEQFNKRYLELVREYHSVIAGQFFGFFHSDSFRVFYEKMDKHKGKFLERDPISYLFIAPAVSPRKSSIADEVGPNNPGLRLYQFNTTSGQIFDYRQYYLNLSLANEKNVADWKILYNFTSYYNLPNVSAVSLSDLAFDFMGRSEKQAELFYKYYVANSVGYDDPRNCKDLCRRTHFCVITNIDYQDYERCIQTVLGTFGVSAGRRVASWALLLLLPHMGKFLFSNFPN